MTWQEWKDKYRHEIYHELGYEEYFVDSILAKISNITPDMVIPQFNFKDHKGKNRYIDFVIKINVNDEIKILPIELDGKGKFDTYDIFDDALARQNDLLKQFRFLLRYSNKQMFNYSKSIIKEIHDSVEELKKISDKQSQTIEDIRKSLDELRITNVNAPDNIVRLLSVENDLKDLKEMVSNLEQPKVTIIKDSPTPTKRTNLGYRLLGLVFLSAIVYGLYSLTQSSKGVLENNRYCGIVKQVIIKDDKAYLNFGDKYPKQKFSATLWKGMVTKVSNKFGTPLAYFI